MTTEMTIEQTATERVNSTEALRAYQDLFLGTDWAEGNDHMKWVATAPEADLIAWAKEIRRDQEA